MDALGGPGVGGEGAQHGGELEVVEPAVDRFRQRDARRDLARDALLGEHLLDVGLRAGVQHVAGEEGAHVFGDPVDRLVATLVAERGRDVFGDPGERVAAELERLLELALRPVQVVRGVERLDPLQQGLGGPAVGCDLGLEVERVGVRRGVLQPIEELGRELVRLLDDRLEVRDVALVAPLLARVEAPPNREQQEDDHEHADPERDHPAQHQLALALRARSPGTGA